MPDLPGELRGPRVFGLLNGPEQQNLTPEQRDEVALALRVRLRVVSA